MELKLVNSNGKIHCDCTVTILTYGVDNICRLQIVHDSYQNQVHPNVGNWLNSV